MAVNRSIVITLKLDNGDNSETENPTNTSSTSEKTDKGNTAKAVAVWAAKEAVEIATSEAIAWGEYFWNRELTLKDDYIAQRNKNIATTQINRGLGAISTIGSMTASGAAVGGWVGAIVGAVLGTAIATSGIVRSNIQGQLQEDIVIRQMNAQLDFTRSRAGWSLKAASIGEDL